MSLLENEMFDVVTEPVEAVAPRFELLENRNAHLINAYLHIQESGDTFWGVSRERPDGSLIPQTMAAKLAILKSTLTRVEGLEQRHRHAQGWVDGEHFQEAEEIEKLRARKIGVALPTELFTRFQRAPQSAAEVYAHRQIYGMAFDQLVLDGDPVVSVVDGYETHAKELDIPQRSATLGYSALEMFAFGAGGQTYVDALGSANLAFHQAKVK